MILSLKAINKILVWQKLGAITTLDCAYPRGPMYYYSFITPGLYSSAAGVCNLTTIYIPITFELLCSFWCGRFQKETQRFTIVKRVDSTHEPSTLLRLRICVKDKSRNVPQLIDFHEQITSFECHTSIFKVARPSLWYCILSAPTLPTQQQKSFIHVKIKITLSRFKKNKYTFKK